MLLSIAILAMTVGSSREIRRLRLKKQVKKMARSNLFLAGGGLALISLIRELGSCVDMRTL